MGKSHNIPATQSAFAEKTGLVQAYNGVPQTRTSKMTRIVPSVSAACVVRFRGMPAAWHAGPRGECRHEHLGLLVLLGLDQISVDRLFAQCLARFEPMQPVHEDEAITIAPNQDGRLLPDF